MKVVAICLLAAAVCVAAGKFDHLTSCESCTAAGFGWSEKKNKCGGFPQKTCTGGGGAKMAAATAPKTKAAPAPAPAFKDSAEVLFLPGEAALESALLDHSVLMLQFHSPGSAACESLAPAYSAAADRLKKRGLGAKLANIDATEAAVTAGLYSVTSFPTLILFRDGDMFSTYDGELSADALVEFMAAEVDSDEVADDDTEILRFNIANAQALMTHRLKIQVALFVDEKDSSTDKYIEGMEQAIRAGGYSSQVLGLYIPVDDAKNTPVLDRFFVKAVKAPCVRLAVMYPDGNGIRVYGPPVSPADATRGLADGGPKTTEDFSAFVQMYFAKKLEPLLRSEAGPAMSHPIITDLVGKTVDDFIMEPGKNIVLMLYWATCPHCQALHPGFESVAARVESAIEDMPASGSEIVFGRIEGTRNDIGHRRIYAGSYPLVYYIPADDKENPIQLQDARDESGIWRFLEENTWIGEADNFDKDDL